jgi:hypothetical protein
LNKKIRNTLFKGKDYIAGKVPRNLKEVGGKEEIMKMIKEWQSIFYNCRTVFHI